MNLFAWLMLVDTLVALAFCIFWRNDNYLNQAIKILFGLLTAANLVGALFAFGFVVKIAG